jgi:hypothetical protein
MSKHSRYNTLDIYAPLGVGGKNGQGLNKAS